MSYENKVIHIVGSVDIGSGTGEFLYVNPATAAASQSATAGAAPPANQPPQGTGFELVVEAADGKELSRVRPTILLPSDDHASKTGLIDQNVSYAAGMARLVLLHDGKVVNTFEAGSPEPTVTARSQGLEMGAGPLGHPEKRSMSMAAPDEPGVSYTIQVRPDGEKTWQTIAVGQKSPKVVLDRNQFPAAERATVRVLRSTGFDDSIIAEDEMDLRFKE